jgi:hypothetical protein
MEKQRTLTDTMAIGRKIGLVLDHLQAGGEVEVEGYTWVWLDNHITRTFIDDDGETQHWGINGLATKGVQIDSATKEEKPHYMGQGGLTLGAFIDIVGKIKEEDLLGICASSALRGMNKER